MDWSVLAHALRQARAEQTLPAPAVRRELRVAAGLTFAQAARALGVSKPTAMRWERGSHRPRRERIEDYADFLTHLAAEMARRKVEVR